MDAVTTIENALSAAQRREVRAQPDAGQGSVQLCLWLLTELASLPDAELGRLQLDRSALDELCRQHGPELHSLQLLRTASELMTRRHLAELVRAKANSLALTANTPAELAAIARCLRALPDWVWDDAVVNEGGARPAGAPGLGHGVPAAAQQLNRVLGAWHAYAPYQHDAGPQLNRHQRRVLEAALRKS
jgi:hypothetical protein